MKFRLLSLILIWTFVSIGQTDSSIYITTLGKFKCTPNYKGQYIATSEGIVPVSVLMVYNENTKTYDEVREEGWKGVESTLVPDGELTEFSIYFPKRADSINMVIYPDKTFEQRIEFVDHYTYFNVHDSIFSTALDSLLNNELTVVSNNKNQKILNYDLQILYADGYRFFKKIKKNKIIFDKEIKKHIRGHKIIYIGIYNINIKNTKGKLVSISDGYGWKIINRR